MEHPRRVEIFNILNNNKNNNIIEKKEEMKTTPTIEIIKNLRSEYLSSVCSRNCFHENENVNILACGNSSGRVHIFS
jgi:hypothetical protein